MRGKQRWIFVIGALAVAVGLGTPLAMAGDDKVEGQAETQLDTAGLEIVYRYTGARDNNGSGIGATATSVHCTNTGTSGDIGILSIFIDFDGDQVGGAPAATIPPLETRTFSTDNTAVYSEDVIVDLAGSVLNQGHGIIFVATGDPANLICTAQVVDPVNNPPTFVVNLTLFRE